ncbi:MAG: hypothetical protein VYB46_16380 [Pseudomonadota bacterium]|nr:hypothetical protein [Pseudomonadota bacterium]
MGCKVLISRAAIMAVVGAVAGCASSGYRMPPPGAAPYAAPAAPYAAAPYPAPAYAPVPALPTPAPTIPVAAPAPAPVDGISGLTEREPDLCGARTHAAAVGQPSSAIAGLGLTKTYRVVEYRGIEPQDYDPNRIVFRLDAAGIITKVDCG